MNKHSVEGKAVLSIAEAAARRAGDFLLKEGRLHKKVHKDEGRDIKIAADTASESIIIEYLKKHSDYPILSEERGTVSGDDGTYRWIVDPVDGSFNFVRGFPLYCVSVGLWRGAEPHVGVIYDCERRELFSGIAGGGAWCNGRAIAVSDTGEKAKAVLCTGFPAHTDYSSEGMKAFMERARTYKKVRMLGAAALMLAYVACGRADVYSENDILVWDVAGGIPIVMGAGGKVSIQKATREHSYHVYASNGKLG